ncbi:MAG: c-type cytochrome [Proteobacteria bacterium]|nr:c-type cytochrome [Pseudomonadota bacterium]
MKRSRNDVRVEGLPGLSVLVFALALACSEPAPPEEASAPELSPDSAPGLAERANSALGALPTPPAAAEGVAAARVALGRQLYHDARLSKNHDVSCASCHQLDRFGVDGDATSAGHRGQRGDRNAPTVLNASLHVAQFWDGRAADVEEQAKGPVLNPIEMALPDVAAAEAVLRSIPGYRPAFEAAFPDAPEPVSFDHMAVAIGAFERQLLTPGPLDAFLAGDASALSAEQQAGLETFLTVGCITCHMGPAVGGSLYRKLGLVRPFETSDVGRFAVTGNEADRGVFKVPSLRNVAETGPWFHDGSVTELAEAVRLMGHHQLGVDLSESQVRQLVAFLESLTGTVDPDLAAAPELPASGPDTPAPDPS